MRHGQTGMLEHFTFLPSLSSRHFFSAYLAWIRLQRHTNLSKYLIPLYHLVVWCISVTVQYTFPTFQKYFNLRPCFTFTFLLLKNISIPGWLACSLLKLGLCCLLDWPGHQHHHHHQLHRDHHHHHHRYHWHHHHQRLRWCLATPTPMRRSTLRRSSTWEQRCSFKDHDHHHTHSHN